MALLPFRNQEEANQQGKSGMDGSTSMPFQPITAPYIRAKYENSQKYFLEEQWNYQINRTFMNGNQWIWRDKVQNTLRSVPRDPSRTRVTVNRIWPTSRHLIAKLLSRPLVFEVPPEESDDATVRGAKKAEAVLMSLYKDHNWELMREETAWNTWLGGTGVLAIDWDPGAGPTIGHTEFGRSFGKGEIVETPLTLLEVAWEPGTKNAETGLWWARVQALPPAEVQATYDLPKLPPADVTAARGFLGRSLVPDDRITTPAALTMVITYYERPSSKRPKGAVCTVVGNKIVDGPHDWPFPFKDRLNMVVFRETKVSGRSTGDTVVTAAIPVQTAYNAAWSNLVEHLKLAGNARLMIPDASVDAIDELSDLPGEIVMYNAAGGAPEFLAPPQLPSWVIQQPEMLGAQLDDILGLHDVSRGMAPTNIESGIGLSVLVEQDATPLGQMTRELAHGFERFARMALEIYADKVKSSRVAKIQKPGSLPEVVAWTGKDLMGQVGAMIPMDAVMPRSRTAMMAFAREMWNNKVIQDPKMFARIADLPDQQSFIDALDRDDAKAQRENEQMAAGVVQLPAEFDVHKTHIKAHNEFRKSLRYETMSEHDRELVDKHIKGHVVMEAEAAGMMAQKAQVHPALGMASDGLGTPPQPTLPDPMTGAPGGFVPGMEPATQMAGEMVDQQVAAQGGNQAPSGGAPLETEGVPLGPVG